MSDSVFVWVGRCRRAWSALAEIGMDPDDVGLCFQCPHTSGKKQVIECTGLEIYLCPKCHRELVRALSDDAAALSD